MGNFGAEVRPRLENRQKVLNFLERYQFERVVDIGGSQDIWAREYVHYTVDQWDPMEWAQKYPDTLEDGLIEKVKWIEGDLDDHKLWAKLRRMKKFDFAICSHTVEHLSNPSLMLSQLPMIASEGVIMVPHKTTELKKGVHWDVPCRGMIPHRWICSFQDDVFRLYPKLSFIEALDFPWVDSLENDMGELVFWWTGELLYEVVSDKEIDFPDPQPAITLYTKRLKEGL